MAAARHFDLRKGPATAVALRLQSAVNPQMTSTDNQVHAAVPQDPSVRDLRQGYDSKREGAEMYGLIKELYPICRSITGNGVRQSLRTLQQCIPLSLYEIPTGTRVFDWTVPKEWNIRDAYIKTASGERVVDFRNSNLHVVNYSTPIRTRMRLAELRDHIFTLPDNPDWIPYRTSYYSEDWGFCLSHRQLNSLKEEEYRGLH